MKYLQKEPSIILFPISIAQKALCKAKLNRLILGATLITMTTFQAKLNAQLTIDSLSITPSSCASNGEVIAHVNGGSGDYTFTLSNNCGYDTISQNNDPIFTTLQPCPFYKICVTDQVTLDFVCDTFEIEAHYTNMEIDLAPYNCGLVIQIQGGATPFNYFYSTIDAQGQYTPLPDSTIPPLMDPMVYVKVIDNCGNQIFDESSTTIGAVSGFSDIQSDSALVINPWNGSPPFEFTLQSDAGIFTNNTGVFPWDQVGCNPVMMITDACQNSIQDDVSIYVAVGYDCVSFEDGYAEVIPNIPSIGPYTFTVSTPLGTFTSSTGILIAYHRILTIIHLILKMPVDR